MAQGKPGGGASEYTTLYIVVGGGKIMYDSFI